MTRAKRRQASWAVTASVVAHLVIGVVLVLQKPALFRPLVDASGPPEAIIPVLILPRSPPQTTQGSKARPAPLRLHRRPQPNLPPEVRPAPIAPPAPVAVAPAPPAPRGVVVTHPAPLPEGPQGDVRTALRHGPVGCANPIAVGLNRSERDHCNEVLGKGAKDAVFAGLGLTPDKERLLDAAGAKKEADYRFKSAPATPGVPEGSLGNGRTAEQMCADAGVRPDECGAHMHR